MDGRHLGWSDPAEAQNPAYRRPVPSHSSLVPCAGVVCRVISRFRATRVLEQVFGHGARLGLLVAADRHRSTTCRMFPHPVTGPVAPDHPSTGCPSTPRWTHEKTPTTSHEAVGVYCSAQADSSSTPRRRDPLARCRRRAGAQPFSGGLLVLPESGRGLTGGQ